MLPDNPFLNTKQFISSLKEGDEESFALLFRTFYPALLNYAGRIVRDREMANDIVQGTFCNLYENKGNITIHLSIKSYLYRTVYNSCIDLLRHKKVTEAYKNAEMLDFYFSQIIQQPEAELKIHNQDIHQAVKEAISQLPERCRTIFCLSKLERLSNKQISEQLGITIKTVETQMSTAYTRLRSELEWLLLVIFFVNSLNYYQGKSIFIRHKYVKENKYDAPNRKPGRMDFTDSKRRSRH